MTPVEQNAVLTQTGPGTPLGNVFRRYWIPALLSRELGKVAVRSKILSEDMWATRDASGKVTFRTRQVPNIELGVVYQENWLPVLLSEDLPDVDCAPVRVQIGEEKLIAFRDTSGRIGLVDQFCAHRRVSLFFGRNEENGIRCPYHGWKFDVNGKCVEVPSEGENSKTCERVQLKHYRTVETGGVIFAYVGAEAALPALDFTPEWVPATTSEYPAIEVGDVVWVYMGPADRMPEAPEFEWATVPASHRYINYRVQRSNWLQAMEGGIDSSHVSSLHSGELHKDPLHHGKGASNQADKAPLFEVAPSPAGLLIGAKRKTAEGNAYWRISQYVFPSSTMIPPYGEHPLHGHNWVPVDDSSCLAWNFTHTPHRPLTEEEIQTMDNYGSIYAELIPGTHNTVQNESNDWLIDREKQKTGRYYSGIKGIAMQDASLQESMAGENGIVDRTKERLVATDVAIVQARRKLLATAQALAAGDESVLAGLDPTSHHIRSASFEAAYDTTLAVASEKIVADASVVPVSI